MHTQSLLLVLLNVSSILALPRSEKCSPITCHNPTLSTESSSLSLCPGSLTGCASQVSGAGSICFQPSSCGKSCKSNSDCASNSRCVDISGLCGTPTCQKISCESSPKTDLRARDSQTSSNTSPQKPENVNVRMQAQTPVEHDTVPARQVNVKRDFVLDARDSTSNTTAPGVNADATSKKDPENVNLRLDAQTPQKYNTPPARPVSINV